MIRNCRSAFRAKRLAPIGLALAGLALAAGAAPSRAQTAPGAGLQGFTVQSDACAGATLASGPAPCHAASERTSSKYNLLYADDMPANEEARSAPGDPLSDRSARRASEDARRSSLRGETTGC